MVGKGGLNFVEGDLGFRRGRYESRDWFLEDEFLVLREFVGERWGGIIGKIVIIEIWGGIAMGVLCV